MQTQIDFTALELARQGESRSYAASPTSWREAALAALKIVCERNATFLVDSVWQELGDVVACKDKRAMAGVLSEGERLGYCVRTTELRRSEQKGNHGNLRSLWRSLITN